MTRFLSLTALAFGTLALTSCGGDDTTSGETTTTTTTTTATSTGKAFSLQAGPISLTGNDLGFALKRGDATLLRFSLESFEWGVVPQIEDINYDPYRVYIAHPLYTPPDITWVQPTSMKVSDVVDRTVTVNLTYPENAKATVTFEALADGRIEGLWKPQEAGNIAFHRLRPEIGETEGLYGLGEYFDSVNHRGKVRAMQIELDSTLESGYNEAHVPVPFLVGTNGWGLFVETDRPGAFAVASEWPEWVEAAFGTAPDSGSGLKFHLFGAERPLDVIKLYYDVTGYPKIPAPWALGPWVWRDENKDQAEFLSDAHTIRDLDLATSAMWIDRPYATAVNTFDFLPSQFPDPQAMIDEAHDLGFRMALWHTPYLDEKGQKDETAALRDYAESNGYYPPVSGLPLNGWGRPIDLTNPDAYSWWQSNIQKYTSMGIEGFKLDYAEDVVPGVTSARNEWKFADGSDERTMNGGYQRFYHKVYSETLPQDGGFLLCRGGTYGDQTNVSVIWPGDLDATFGHHREEMVDQNGEKFTGVGGLPASIVAGLSLGPSGFPFFGADTGGYKHSPPDKELFTRWFEQTAFWPVMQIGTSTNSVAWDPASGPGFDDEMLGWYREYTRWHLRLFPYLWRYANLIKTNGRPIARPFGLAYPERGIHPNDVYLLGDNLLIAPVVDRGATSREVPLPPGDWVDFWTGEIYHGDDTPKITVSAPLGKIPVFQRAGSAIPLLRPTIDTLSPTTLPGQIDSFATSAGVLYWRVAALQPDVIVQDYAHDGAHLTLDEGAPGTTFLMTATSGGDFKEGALIELMPAGDLPPTEVTTLDGVLSEAASLDTLEVSGSGWYFSPEDGGRLYVRVPGGDQSIKVTYP